MFNWFFYDLLEFCARKFPEKFGENEAFFADSTLYLCTSVTGVYTPSYKFEYDEI